MKLGQHKHERGWVFPFPRCRHHRIEGAHGTATQERDDCFPVIKPLEAVDSRLVRLREPGVRQEQIQVLLEEVEAPG